MKSIRMVLTVFLMLMLVAQAAYASSPYQQTEKLQLLNPLGADTSQYSPWVMHDNSQGSDLMFYCKNTSINGVWRDRVWRSENWSGGKTGWGNDQIVIEGTFGEDDDLSCSPGVVVDGNGTWHMYYAGSKRGWPTPIYLFHATSSDSGTSWTKIGPIGIPLEAHLDYLETPSPLYINGTIIIYFVGSYGNLYRAEATDSSGHMLSTPQIVHAPQGVSHGRVTFYQGVYYYVYSKEYVSNSLPPKKSYLATSTDGVNFYEVEGPLMYSNGSDWDGSLMWSPHLVVRNGEFLVYYAGNLGSYSGFWGVNTSIGLRVFQLGLGASPQIVEAEDATSVTHVGAWMVDNPGHTYSNGAVLVSNAAGSKLSAGSLYGRYVTLSYWNGPNRGIANVYNGGVLLGKIDMYAPAYAGTAQQVIWDLGFAQQIQFDVVVDGTKNSQSTNQFLCVDRFEAHNPTNTFEAEDTSWVSRKGKWTVDNPGYTYSNGAMLVSNVTGRKLSVGSLNSRYVTLNYWSGPNRGIANVYKGCVLTGQIDMYSPTYNQTAATIAWDFGSTQHVQLDVVVSGQKNTLSTNYYVSVDRFEASDTPGSGGYISVPPTPPGPPSIGTVTAGNGQATFAFTPPNSDGGSPITGYTVTSNPGGISASGASSPLTVTGLTNGTAYTFTVTATNSVGIGCGSTTSNSLTPATVPGAPTIGAATADNGNATASFTPPASDGGSPITSYTVTSNPGGISVSGTDSPLAVMGLTHGTPYTFTVTATNSIGTGGASAPSNSLTLLTVPGPPAIGTATAGNGNATVTFTPPASDGGSPISGYTVISTPGGISGSGADSPIIVTGLTNGTAYTFTVTATSSAGTGSASAASNPVAPATVPGAPVIGTAVAGDGRARVLFTPPALDGGSAIATYTVTANPGGFAASGATSPVIVPNLSNGTAYTFTVVAGNPVGTGPASSPSNSVVPNQDAEAWCRP